MRRNFLYNILLATSLVGMTACSDYVDNETYTVGKTDNEIRFATGVVSESASRAASRAVYNTESYEFLPLAQGTKLHIKTEGTWTGKANEGAVTHYTKTGTAGAPGTDKSPITGVGIYWDDYGIADPENSTNREAGINVYAACLDGKNASAIGNIGDWESLSWTTKPGDSQSWQDKDLLFSNNNSDEGATNSTNMNKNNVGRYTFDTQKGGTDCNLEFHHAMSKITVNLKAGKGFTDAKFASDPTVTLQSVKLNGSVNIKALTATASGEATTAAIAKSSTTTENYTATYEGLVFPGNELAESQKAAAKSGGFAKINCDGNIYNIYADELMAAMYAAENNTADYVFHSGKNYIINIIVDKTEIKVTATVTDWVNVTAETVTPKINVTTSLGAKDNGTLAAFTSFDFYMRKDGVATYTQQGGKATGTANGTTPWTFESPIYWPSHNAHYHMRGVYPSSTTVADNNIVVANATYNASSAPSCLMVGAPELTEDTKMCDNVDHTSVDMSQYGICARDANINLNFRYMMSQVEVHLTSSDGTMPLSGAVVEVLNGYTAAKVDIDSRTITDRSTVGNFTIDHSGSEDANYRHAVIVPQNLNNGTNDLQFRITITNSDGTKDYYYATIKDIAVSENGGDATTISAWESGKRYVYTLDMKKTGIKVTATLKDWIETTGSTTIWM